MTSAIREPQWGRISATSRAFEGTATLNEGQAKTLTTGQTYFNIPTQVNPNGDARGQVVKPQLAAQAVVAEGNAK